MELTRQQKAVLGVVELDADLPAPVVAKRCRLQTPTVQRILARFVDTGLIAGRTAVIDLGKLGILEYGVNFRLGSIPDRERLRFVEYLKSKREVSWIAEVGSRFDLMTNVVARTPHEVVEFLRRLSGKFPNAVASKSVSVRTERMRFGRGFLGPRQSSAPRFHSGSEFGTESLDELDTRILRALTASSFESYREIARSIEVPVATFLRRVQGLRDSGILLGFGYRLNLEILGISQFRMLLSFRDLSSAARSRFVKLCGAHGHIKMLSASLGSADYELEVDVFEPSMMGSIASLFREEFGEGLQSIESVPIYRHVKFISFPAI